MVTKSQLWATSLLVGMFVAGVVVGIGVDNQWHGGRPAERPQGDRQQRGERGFVATLTKELNLTDVQKDSVRTILRTYDPAFRAVMDGTRPKFDSLRALVHADIKGVLDKQQQEAFARWTVRMDSLTARRRAKEADERRDKEKNRAR